MYKSFPRILRTRIDWQVIKSHHQRSPERHLSACSLHLLQQNPSISRFQDNIATKSEHFSFSNGKPVGLIDQVVVALRRLGSGNSFVVIGNSFGLSHSTVSQITWIR
ncbi:protein ALP1 [Trifolium repens]|nr:protein ALP1 [Trifolium repens]